MSPPSPRVSVILRDTTGYEAEMARRLEATLPAVTLRDNPDPYADITYFIGAEARTKPAEGLEMVWFTQVDSDDPDTALCRIAREIDQPVTGDIHSRDMLRRAGARSAIAIPRGVDRTGFELVLRIGVVGHPTDAPPLGLVDVTWFHLTVTDLQRGAGDLPDRLRGLDAILWYGPTPQARPVILAALAVGTQVIAPDSGWDRDLPHLHFRQGEGADLLRVLTDLRAGKTLLRASTENNSWDSVCAAHELLFQKVVARGVTAPAEPVPLRAPVSLMLHGSENITLGGPSVRVPRTARALRELGIAARNTVFTTNSAKEPDDIVHLFNVWPPDSALRALRALKAAEKTVVFSPIYLDLSERPFWQFDLPDLIRRNDVLLADHLAEARAHLATRGRKAEILPGYHAMVREMLTLADHVIFLSTSERAALADIGATVEDQRASLVHNPVDANLWEDSDPARFRETWLADRPGPTDYIICIGRIEERKNQLMLARAMRDLPLRLVLIGHEGSPDYAKRIRAEAGSAVLMTGRLEPNSAMLRSALVGASAFALPSWAEGAALAALEAAATGVSLALSDRSSEAEYFGDLANLCDPGDPVALRDTLMTAVARGRDPAHAQALKAMVRDRFGWDRYASATAHAYAKARAAATKPAGNIAPVRSEVQATELAVDLTALVHGPERCQTSARLNARIVTALQEVEPGLRKICWDEDSGRFIELPARLMRLDRAVNYGQNPQSAARAATANLPPGCMLLTLANPDKPTTAAHLQALADLKMRTGCGILAMVHDALPESAEDLAHSAVSRPVIAWHAEIADGFVTSSTSCAADLARHTGAAGRCRMPILLVQPTDISPQSIPADADAMLHNRFGDLDFVLAQGDVDAAGNHDMLCRLWARFADQGRHCDLHLIIAGALAPEGKVLAKHIWSTPNLQARVHLLADPTEADLAWLHETCLFAVYPDRGHGFALPVCESLARGKACLTASQVALPDWAADQAIRLDPEDFIGWATRISLLADNSAARAVKGGMPIVDGYSCKEAARDIARLMRTPHVPREARRLHAGELAGADCAALPLSIRFGADWHPAQDWGRWATGPVASFTINVAGCLRPGLDRLIARLVLRADLPGDASRMFQVTCRDHSVFASPVTARNFPNTLLLSVPVAAAQPDGLLTLTLHLPAARGGRIGVRVVALLDPVLANPLQAAPDPTIWSEGDRPMHLDLVRKTHRDAVAPGLAFSEAWGLGSPDGHCVLHIPLTPGAPAQVLSLTIRPVATTETSVTACILWNGRVLAEPRWHSDRPETLTLTLDASDLDTCGPAVLEVHCDSIATPVDLDLGQTQSLAGFGLFDLILTPAEPET